MPITQSNNTAMNKKQKISLNEIGTELPFTVPENYFENLTPQITIQTSEQHVPVRKMLHSWLYMAGMFIGIFLLGNIVYTVYQQNINLKLENYERYLFSQVDDVSLLDFYIEEFE